MGRYLRCVSCKRVLDTVLGTVVTGGAVVTQTGVAKDGVSSEDLRKAIEASMPDVCVACAFVAERTPRSTPPDPATYSKMSR